jgi:hypothetical protein
MQETKGLRYGVQLAITTVEQWMRAKPDSFGTRDWFLRHFRKNAEILEEDTSV